MSTEGDTDRSVQVLQLSDVHMVEAGDLYGRDPAETLDAVCRDVRERGLRPDIAVVTGDLVHDGSVAGYERLGSALAELGVPVYCVAGNHDFVQPLEAGLPRPGVHLERLVRLGDWQFVFLDSNANGWQEVEPGHRRDASDRYLRAVTGSVHPGDRAWLAGVLDTTSAAHVFVWLHHPPVAPADYAGLARPEFRDPLFAVLGRPVVRAVAGGHLHTSWEGALDGIRVFACPSTWLAMDFEAMTTAPPGYRWYRLDPSGAVEAATYHVTDGRWASREALPPWTVKMIAGDFDHQAVEGMAQDDIIAGFGASSSEHP